MSILRFRDRDVEQAIETLPVRTNKQGYDPWGFNPEKSKQYYAAAHLVYKYFRPVIHGIENVPRGRVLVVPNHSGQLPFDGMVITMALLLNANPPCLPRAMVERWFPTLPFVNIAFSRSGCVVGDPINCRNLLEADNAILVFPEGVKGSGKTWPNRYKLAPFGRGFMRLALQTHTPIVPTAVIGGEESIISLYDVKPLAKLLRMPYFPVPPLLPVLGLLSVLPMPVRFHIYFGEPMHFSGPFDDEDGVIQQKVNKVMDRVQGMIDQGRESRESLFR